MGLAAPAAACASAAKRRAFLKAGRALPFLLTPGPTPLPPAVRRALGEPIPHHRSPDFKELLGSLRARLGRVLGFSGELVVMSASGTGAMESAVVNLLSPGDKAVVAVTGVFGERFLKILAAYGVSAAAVRPEPGRRVEPGELRRALAENPGAKAVFMQHVDTSTGVLNDVRALAAAVRESSEALVVVDAVSAAAVEPIEAQNWGLDTVLTASQKGLMNSPGLAFAAVSERAWRAAESAKSPRFYFDWRTMREFAQKGQTPYTPPISLLLAQSEALGLIEKEGLSKRFERMAAQAQFLRSKLKALGFELFTKDPGRGLSVFFPPAGADPAQLAARLDSESGLRVAQGQGDLKGKVVRIAHMGHISKADLSRVIRSLGRILGQETKRNEMKRRETKSHGSF